MGLEQDCRNAQAIIVTEPVTPTVVGRTAFIVAPYDTVTMGAGHS